MAIPNLPIFYDMAITEKGERMSNEAILYNDNLWQSLNLAIRIINDIVTTNISSLTTLNDITNNGIVFPSKTNAQITTLEPDATVGTVWFSTTDAKLKVKTAAATIETIQSV